MKIPKFLALPLLFCTFISPAVTSAPTITNKGLAIDPTSFTGDKASGSTISFNIVQQNIDKINLTYDLGTGMSFLETRVAPLAQSNNFTFPIPKDFIGNIKITAFGYSDKRLLGQNVHTIFVQAPASLNLHSIRYENPDVTIMEHNTVRFKLLGTYSDGIERRINNITGITYVIDNPAIIQQKDESTAEGLALGETTLKATVGKLTAELNVFVEKNPSLLTQ